MATTIYPTVPVAQPEPDPWPVDDHPLGIQADEMFARRLDAAFAGEGPYEALTGISRMVSMCVEGNDLGTRAPFDV
jgi:hypothetical protein